VVAAPWRVVIRDREGTAHGTPRCCCCARSEACGPTVRGALDLKQNGSDNAVSLMFNKGGWIAFSACRDKVSEKHNLSTKTKTQYSMSEK
jgi:hypothetical protein